MTSRSTFYDRRCERRSGQAASRISSAPENDNIQETHQRTRLILFTLSLITLVSLTSLADPLGPLVASHLSPSNASSLSHTMPYIINSLTKYADAHPTSIVGKVVSTIAFVIAIARMFQRGIDISAFTVLL